MAVVLQRFGFFPFRLFVVRGISVMYIYITVALALLQGCTVDVFVELLNTGQEQHLPRMVFAGESQHRSCLLHFGQDEGDSSASAAMILAAEQSLGSQRLPNT